jgi:hypothetical protein
MNIYDLSILRKSGQEYDLDQRTFNYRINTPFFEYVVDPTEEMRIDLVCRTIYGSIKYVGFLMYFNNIDNPMNIKSGDVIRYAPEDLVGLFEIANDERISQEFLQNLNRSTQLDPNRVEYNSRYTNPTFNSVPVEQVTDRNGVIIIGNRE